MLIHVVRRGETLYLISRRYNININQIIAVNQLQNPGQLVVGEALVIPVPEARVHVVRMGETLYAIAQKYGTTVEALMRGNQLSNPNLIFIGQRLNISKPIIEVNGYMPQTGGIGQQMARETGEYLTYMCVFSFHVQADGGLISLNDAALLEIARQEGVTPLMSITNFAGRRFSSELAHSVLSSTDVQNTLLDNVTAIMRNRGYRGLNIDFEYVFPEDRELYNQFLRRTVNRLRPEGFSVSTALAPKVSAAQPGLLYEAHDYPVHGRLADFVILMTYEWGYAAGRPWAIAPINEVRRVLDYAVTAIPRNKILMGMPLYGRDWKLPYIAGTTIAETISPPEAVNRAFRYGADIQFNMLYQSPFFNYTDQNGAAHEVWFEDARSVQVKYDTVKAYGLRGVSYWELTSVFPQNWPVLAANFEIRK